MTHNKHLIIGTGKLGRRFYHYLSQSESKDTLITLSRSAKDWSKHQIIADLHDAKWSLPPITHLAQVTIIVAPDARDEANYQHTYIQLVTNLVTELKKQHRDFHVTFVSSTSVYAAEQLGIITEATTPKPESFSGKILLQAEQNLMSLHQSVSIIRPSGLYSSNRQRLIDSLLDKKQYHNPKWLNLIHEQDLCQWINFVSEKKIPLSIASDGSPFQRQQLQDAANGQEPQSISPERCLHSTYLTQVNLTYPSIFSWLKL